MLADDVEEGAVGMELVGIGVWDGGIRCFNDSHGSGFCSLLVHLDFSYLEHLADELRHVAIVGDVGSHRVEDRWHTQCRHSLDEVLVCGDVHARQLHIDICRRPKPLQVI